MLSFRTELENPLVEKDIIELEKKIRLFREGRIPEEKFRSLRLARGVYGQRQPGVQMVRIKLPYGKMTFKQWSRIADISDEYATGNLHLTTRQDIQLHFVSLDKTPELWAKLEQDDITLREACGNTVRNVTASPTAGIDPGEPFDVTPYAHATFRYFLRNPICQDMGRKFKIAFSSSEADTGLAYMHDLGMIPKVKVENGVERRGFKVMIGGGLGAQPFLAQEAFEFLEEEKLIPYIEAVLRVFDRYGERNSRHKARLKFLINKIGLAEFSRLVEEERLSLAHQTFSIDRRVGMLQQVPDGSAEVPVHAIADKAGYERWLKTNVFEQKQAGYYGVYIRVPRGDIRSDAARLLMEAFRPYVADDVRVTASQDLLLKFVLKKYLPYLYSVLEKTGFAFAGYNSVANITSCPGTDTCNLGISSSTGIANVLERLIEEEYPDLIYNQDIKIKISGCMNSCGQHGMAHIGFHGSSLKSGNRVLPALQVLLGGGTLGNGQGRVAEKIIKVPSKRGPAVLRALLDDYADHAQPGESFNDYYDRQGNKYFYALLKPLADLSNLVDDDFVDWGQAEKFNTAIGVGECAGVMIDLVGTLLLESDEKLEYAEESLNDQRYADSIYHSYAAFINAAKALLLEKNVTCNTQAGIIRDFDTHFVQPGTFVLDTNFSELVLQLNKQAPSESFAKSYLEAAKKFVRAVTAHRSKTVLEHAN